MHGIAAPKRRFSKGLGVTRRLEGEHDTYLEDKVLGGNKSQKAIACARTPLAAGAGADKMGAVRKRENEDFWRPKGPSYNPYIVAWCATLIGAKGY